MKASLDIKIAFLNKMKSVKLNCRPVEISPENVKQNMVTVFLLDFCSQFSIYNEVLQTIFHLGVCRIKARGSTDSTNFLFRRL